MRTFEFVYYLFWIGVLIGALRLAELAKHAPRDADARRSERGADAQA